MVERLIRERVLRSIDRPATVAYLKCQGIKYIRYERHGDKVIFLYDDTPEFRRAFHAYLNRTNHAKVDPQEFNNNVVEILHVVRAALNEKEGEK